MSSNTLSVRLSSEHMEMLEEASEREALPKSTLARSIIVKELRKEKGADDE